MPRPNCQQSSYTRCAPLSYAVLRTAAHIPMHNENTIQAVAIAPPASDGRPPRVSLLGLPTEPRMHIYGFLVCVKRELRIPEHCCSRLTKHRDDATHHEEWRRIKCTCASETWPSGLATNRQIFDEAMPMLYRNMEMRVILPPVVRRHNDLGHFQNSLAIIPGYGRPHVNNIVLVGSTKDTAIRCHGNDGSMPNFQWKNIIDSLSNVKTVRLHFDMSLGTTALAVFDYSQFAEVATLPNLTTFSIEFHYCLFNGRADIENTSAIIGSKLRTSIQTRAGSLGKMIDVSFVNSCALFRPGR